MVAAAPGPASAAIPPGLRVLVAEDEPLLAMDLKRELGALGLQVVAMPELQRQVEGAAGRVDLAMLDVNLAGQKSQPQDGSTRIPAGVDHGSMEVPNVMHSLAPCAAPGLRTEEKPTSQFLGRVTLPWLLGRFSVMSTEGVGGELKECHGNFANIYRGGRRPAEVPRPCLQLPPRLEAGHGADCHAPGGALAGIPTSRAPRPRSGQRSTNRLYAGRNGRWPMADTAGDG